MTIDRIKFDDRGLVPAIVQDADSGFVLMAAYMNRESLERTIASGEVHFWSRSREALWRKGETSGNVLRLRSIVADCDLDCLLVRAEPAGPACHTGQRSCFFETIEGETLIGEVSLIWRSAEARQGELGWIFHPDFHGRGYATEATNALLDLGFGPADLHRIYARCDARNEPSWRLMERLGMRREAHFRQHGLFKGAWDEEFYYAILRDEWLSRRH